MKEKGFRLGNFKYIVSSLFTHLDDPNESVQKAVKCVLEEAAKFKAEEFLGIAREAQGKHKHPRAVSELITMASMLVNL